MHCVANIMVFVILLEDYLRYAHGLISEYISEDLSKDLLKYLQYVHIHVFSCTHRSHNLTNLSSQTGYCQTIIHIFTLLSIVTFSLSCYKVARDIQP